MVVSTGTRRVWPVRDVGRSPTSISMTSDWDDQWLTSGLEPDVIAEAHLDPASIFSKIQRFARIASAHLPSARSARKTLGSRRYAVGSRRAGASAPGENQASAPPRPESRNRKAFRSSLRGCIRRIPRTGTPSRRGPPRADWIRDDRSHECVAVLLLPEDVIEKATLPQNRAGRAAMCVAGLLFPSGDQPGRWLARRRSLQQEMDMIGHEAVHKNGKAIFLGRVD